LWLQLTTKGKQTLRVKEKLALAASVLLGVPVQAQAIEASPDDWSFEGAILTYSEPNRVTAVEAIVSAEKSTSDTAKVKYKVVLDSLTGASANGAIAQREVQTFTRPSGNGQYQIQAYETPLDDTFKDTRLQVNASYQDNWLPNWTYTLGTNLSREYDYHSVSLNAGIAKDFDRKNTALSAGISYAVDSIIPEGGRPLALSSMVVNEGQYADDVAYRQAFNSSRIIGDGQVKSKEILLGLSQIINRRMLVQLNYGYAQSEGYLTDPFKIVSLVDSAGITQDVIYESRPESRSHNSYFAATKYHFEQSIVDLSYRYLADSWHLKSHTVDFKWHFFLENNRFWQPHIRWYQQTATDFYAPYITATPQTNHFISADYRLGKMNAFTLGFKYGFKLNDGNKVEIRTEYYKQLPQAQSVEVSALSDIELYPTLDAYILQVTYFF
jgi:hypothetical protein